MKYFFLVVTTFTLIFLAPIKYVHVLAVNYGDGLYGEGLYSALSTPTTSLSVSSTSPASAPVCEDAKPSSAPWLYSASAQGRTSILLQFREALSPVSEYVIEYGTKSGDYKFASANIGGKGTTRFLVEQLIPGTTYYFRVRGGNGCATGDWSSELSARTLPRFSSFIGEEIFITETADTPVEIEKAREDYENIQDDENITVNVSIKVVDSDNKPVGGAQVTIYSTPRESVTDDSGMTRFEDVEPGEHRVVIDYKGQTGEQIIDVPNDKSVQEIQFTVQMKPSSPFSDARVIVVISILSIALIFSLSKKYKNK